MRKNIKLIIAVILLLILLFNSYIVYTLNSKNRVDIAVTDSNDSLDLYNDIGIKPGECIYPTPLTSPCQLKCAPTKEEIKMARIAWKYIENNFNKKTGLTAAAHKYPSAATWDWANAVYAIYAARKFNIITQEKYEKMMNTFLKTMQKMEIFNNELPNKTYNTNSAKMTDYVNKVQKDGTGWSAADLARLLSSLNMVEQCEETLAPQIEKLLLRYRYCRALSVEGDLYGGSMENGKLHIRHEALTGYEEYLARGYELWHHNASEARSYKFVKEVDVYGVKIPTDTRPFFSNFIESEPFWYLGFEYGVDDNESGRYIKNMYEVQKRRYERTGQLTAVTEDNIDTRPYFLFNTVYTGGEAWKTINQKGEDYDNYKTVSTKAAIGMRYLFDTPYSNKVFNYVKNNYDPKKGYYAGIYEKRPGQNKAMTLNTNSIILEAMLSSKMGSLQSLHKIENRGAYDYYRNNVNNFRCLPTDNQMTILEPFDTLMTRELNSTKDIENAKVAWRYFENNYHQETGYVNGLNKYKIIKPAHIGKAIISTISAFKLEIIDEEEFNGKISKVLSSLSSMKLYHNELPNLYYNALTGKMVTSAGKDSPTGNGWELYSIAKLMTALYHLEESYPQYRESVFDIISKWDFKRAVLEKSMQNRYFDGKSKGGFTDIKDPAKEYYIFNALNLFNIKSYSYLYDERNLDYKAVNNYEVPMGHKYQITNGESYLWSMLEHPYYIKYKHYSSNIYLSLKGQYTINHKISTSTSEALDKKPYFIENTIYNNGKKWSDLNREKKSVSKSKLISTKAAFIYDALYGYTDSYSAKLLEVVDSNCSSKEGWYGGVYSHNNRVNRSLNISTNSAVLESIFYKRFGNYYYSKHSSLLSSVHLDVIDTNSSFYLESTPIELRHKAQMLMQKLPKDLPYKRLERVGKEFVVRGGSFNSKKDLIFFLESKEESFPEFFEIKEGAIDSTKFVYSSGHYNYNYHIPYKNSIDSVVNKAYSDYLSLKKVVNAQKIKKK